MRDKLRILCIAVLEPLLNLSKKFAEQKEKIDGVINELWRGIVIEINDSKYALVDFESFCIVSTQFENYVSTWLRPRKGETFVDVGAHLGKYTLSMAKLVGNRGRVVAIEPHPLNYVFLQRNIRLNNLINNVTALNLAAWDMDCKLLLFTGRVAGRHSAKINWKLGFTEIEARRTDHILRELRINRVDWIKIDVEGAECEVLYGLEETVTRHKPKIIIEAFSENVNLIKKFMKEHEYSLIKISPSFYADIPPSKSVLPLSKFVYFICIPCASS